MRGSEGIVCALIAQGTGGLGGFSGLYLVREEVSNPTFQREW